MELKLSHYVVISDELNQQMDRIILSTRTGLATTVSRKIHDCLNSGNFESFPDKVLDQLIKNKILVPNNEHELGTIISENKNEISSEDVLYEVIQPSAMCQFGCPYCGQGHTKDYISRDHYALLLDRIEEKISNGHYKTLFIGWFGGEPLMALKQIREVTILLKELAKKYQLNYGAKMVTNGLSLKKGIYEELVHDMAVSSIEITLDGIAKYHDAKRYLKGGGDTFDLIFDNILAICNKPDFYEYRCNLTIRCNVDRLNIDGVSPLIELLAKHGLQHKIAYFYPIGIYSWAGNDAHKGSLTKEEFAELEIDWLLQMIKHGFGVSLLPGRVNKVCLSVSEDSEMFDAFGNVFNCTEVSLSSFYKESEYVLGNIEKPTEISQSRPLGNWNDEILENKFPCSSCKMLPVCGGACPKSWHEDMRACPPNKFNMKDKLALSYIVAKMDIKEFDNYIN